MFDRDNLKQDVQLFKALQHPGVCDDVLDAMVTEARRKGVDIKGTMLEPYVAAKTARAMMPDPAHIPPRMFAAAAPNDAGTPPPPSLPMPMPMPSPPKGPAPSPPRNKNEAPTRRPATDNGGGFFAGIGGTESAVAVVLVVFLAVLVLQKIMKTT